MDAEHLKKMVDACFEAKRVVEMLPELPNGMKPRHIHVLDAVGEIQKERGMCRVSDISARWDTTAPSITRLVQELETLGMLKKSQDETDKRVVRLELTDEGRECVKRYVTDFHSEWAGRLGEISNEQADEMAAMIKKFRYAMPGRKKG